MGSQEHNMTDKEKELFRKTQDGVYEDVKHLILDDKINVNALDEQGMTPLQHAAYRGYFELCKLFLDCGADVNSQHHTSGYGTLTFAGLSGKIDVVRLLLEHGASRTCVNKVNRTPAQMAAFIGNYSVVSVINNFLAKEIIDYFTEPHGLSKEPILPPLLSGPVHKLAVMTNIHPVRLAMYLQTNGLVLENTKSVVRVFTTLCGKQLREEGNELLSIKFHHMSFVIRACVQFLNSQKSKEGSAFDTNKKGILEPLIRRWIKGENDEGFPITLEKFLRQSIREYPYVECSLFQQLIHALVPVKIGDEPGAIFILNQAVNGQKGVDSSIACVTCGEPKASNKCSMCHYVSYCDKYCQKLHWFTHKTVCENFKKKYEIAQKMNVENEGTNQVDAAVEKLTLKE